jgi:O-acetyl-ADP-ribose deacetylase (regulator of RNase III)
MKIEYRIGNLLGHPGTYMVHGCNAQGAMGSGVAKAIRDQYPECYEVYRAAHKAKPLKLGEVVPAKCGRHIVLNGITQEFYGNAGGVFVDYDALREVMRTCDEYISSELQKQGIADPANELTKPELGMPLIGAGLAGGDWQMISAIIEQETHVCVPVVYIVDPEQLRKILPQIA